MSLKMCKCKVCQKNTVGIKTGLSAGGHLLGLVLTFFTGLLFLPLYILMCLCTSTTRCTICGSIAKKL